SVQSARGQVDSAASSLNSSQASYAQASAAPQQSDVDVANAQVDNARASVQIAQNNLQATVMLAPAAGTVSGINGAVGEWVSGGAIGSLTSSNSTSGNAASATGSNTSTTGGLIILTDVSSPQVTAQISEADIGRVRPGEKVTFTVTA